MNNDEIKQLLHKFYEGESTLEEEAALEEYLVNNVVDDEFKTDQRIFVAFHNARAQQCPDALEKQLSEAITRQAKNDAVNEMGKRKRTKRIVSLAAVAASVAVAITVGWNLIGGGKSHVINIEDPDKAYEITASLLPDFSHTLNNGIDKVSEVGALTASISNYNN